MTVLREALIFGLYFAILGALTKTCITIQDSMQKVIIIFFITGIVTYYALIQFKPALYPMFE